MVVLGIESSCDETAAAVYADGQIRSNIIASQSIHEQFGGVVPELASRAHHQTISKTVNQALQEASASMADLDAIAVTQGPGLMGSLLVGLSFAKGLSIAWNKPLIGVNHIDAHLYANFIEHKEVYPFMGLIVSGGHTRLVYVKERFNHEVLGKTLDDAAGEAFDKIGKILNLPYPAGPVIDKLSKNGDPEFYNFPRSMIKKGLDFSFSGLKTSVLYHIKENGEDYAEKNIGDLCASISAAITDVLTAKLKRAVKQKKAAHIVLAGGVSANSMLRKKVQNLADKLGLNLMIPSPQYCTDNAAMIAITGALKAENKLFDSVDLKPFARIPA